MWISRFWGFHANVCVWFESWNLGHVSFNDSELFVDNQENFLKALSERPFEEIFADACYGSFGHATTVGDRMIAEAVGNGILQAYP
jgi:hypothetical protein